MSWTQKNPWMNDKIYEGKLRKYNFKMRRLAKDNSINVKKKKNYWKENRFFSEQLTYTFAKKKNL